MHQKHYRLSSAFEAYLLPMALLSQLARSKGDQLILFRYTPQALYVLCPPSSKLEHLTPRTPSACPFLFLWPIGLQLGDQTELKVVSRARDVFGFVFRLARSAVRYAWTE